MIQNFFCIFFDFQDVYSHPLVVFLKSLVVFQKAVLLSSKTLTFISQFPISKIQCSLLQGLFDKHNQSLCLFQWRLVLEIFPLAGCDQSLEKRPCHYHQWVHLLLPYICFPNAVRCTRPSLETNESLSTGSARSNITHSCTWYPVRVI